MCIGDALVRGSSSMHMHAACLCEIIYYSIRPKLIRAAIASMFMFMLAALLRLAPFLQAAVKLNTPSSERGHGAHIDSGNMVTLK
jgi:hypothetical protein